jgi:CubicO group peptidase (beta-lactamase class C family)
VKRVSKVASMRKSVLAMLYGNYVATGQIDLGKNVEQLGLNDVQAFLPVEKNATLYQLLTARSGIYHDTVNVEMNVVNPRRGSKVPGTYHQYQNWDFNAVGTAFEKSTGKEIFSALEEDMARPIGMQDFDRSLFRKNPQVKDKILLSVHPEYAMYFTTRDLARLGLLMLSDGNWNGKQVMPKGWRDRLTTLVTPAADVHPVANGSLRTQAGLWGYGMLWWVWDAPLWPGAVTGPYQGAYTAIGANGQYLTVLPTLNMVIAHNVVFDYVRDGSNVDMTHPVSWGEYQAILQMLIASRIEN